MEESQLGHRPGVTTEHLVASGSSPTLILDFCISRTPPTPIYPTGLLGNRAEETMLAQMLREHQV